MNTRLLNKVRNDIFIFPDGEKFRVIWKRYEGPYSMVSGPMTEERAKEVEKEWIRRNTMKVDKRDNRNKRHQEKRRLNPGLYD